MSANNTDTRTYQVLLRIVLPLGSAVWAFSQIMRELSMAVEIVLLGIMAIGMFAAFQTTIIMADNRLNGGAS